jgi:hypothetical protein
MPPLPRRRFLQNAGLGAAAASLGLNAPSVLAQIAGDRPARSPDVTVLNPRARVPVALMIDDSS